MDLTAYVPKLPKPGETLQGSSYITVPGGKGNNQSVAASRLGAPTKFVGRVGTDGFGEQVLQIVGEQKVDLSQVMKDPENGTGIAVICVDQNAENSIIIISGVNFALDDSDVARASSVMDDAKVLMLQLEVPLDACLKAAKAAKEKGVQVVWDPAPAVPLPDEAFKLMDFVTPNETETEILVGFKPENAKDASKAAKLFLEKGVGTAVIKMGAKGVYYENKDESGFIPPYKVNPIDTVAAGDAFNAGLAVAISEGKPLAEAVRWGAAAGAIATTRKGALPAMPYREELETLMKEQA
jgi:ribokinase